MTENVSLLTLKGKVRRGDYIGVGDEALLGRVIDATEEGFTFHYVVNKPGVTGYEHQFMTYSYESLVVVAWYPKEAMALVNAFVQDISTKRGYQQIIDAKCKTIDKLDGQLLEMKDKMKELEAVLASYTTLKE